MKDLYNKLVPFLRDVFLDVKESKRSFKEYFDPREGNIELFKQTNLFKKHLLQYRERNEIVKQLFDKMRKDFNDGVAHLYIPGRDNNFTNEQKVIFYKLADLLTQQTGANTRPPSPEETSSATTKRLKEAGNLEIIEPLKLNRKTGFIEGKVRNPNDRGSGAGHGAEVLSLMIDPNNPDEIFFGNGDGNIAFALENSINGLGIFIGASTLDVMVLAGYMGTTGGILRKRSEPAQGLATQGLATQGLAVQGGAAQDLGPQGLATQGVEERKPESTLLETEPQGAFVTPIAPTTVSADLKEGLIGVGVSTGVSTETEETGAGTQPYKQIKGAPQPRILEYTPRAEGAEDPEGAEDSQIKRLPGRYTEQGLKDKKKRDEEEKAGIQPQQSQQPQQQQGPGSTAKPEEETEEKATQPGKKSKGKTALLAKVGAGVVGGSGLVATILTAADII